MYKRSIKTGRIRRYRKTEKSIHYLVDNSNVLHSQESSLKMLLSILCDEPTGSLDKDNAQDIINIFKGNETTQD